MPSINIDLCLFTSGPLNATIPIEDYESMQNVDFTKYFGKYTIVETDMGCGEPVSWGYPIIKQLGPELWDKLKLQYKVCRSNHSHISADWYVITKTLTRNEAIDKYGPISNEVLGKLGGFKSARFGDKTFYSKYLRKE